LIGIRELARHLDISIGTVSRALNNKADVNPQTRERVREAAARLGYSPNQSGRSLRRGQTDLVGVLIPTGSDHSLISNVFLSVLDGLRQSLSAQGLDLAIFLHGPDEDVFQSLRRIAERSLADGLIISNTRRIESRIDYLTEKRRAFVAFGRSESGGSHAWIDPDFEDAVQGAVEQIAALGHRRVMLVLPDAETNFLAIIADTFMRAMRRHGCEVANEPILRRPAGERGGAEAAEALLAMRPRPTALLVSDSMQAVGLYRRFDEAGLKVGRDVAVIGILPEARAEALTPTLATYQTDWTEIGVRLGDALAVEIARMAGASPRRLERPTQLLMPVTFRPGESLQGTG